MTRSIALLITRVARQEAIDIIEEAIQDAPDVTVRNASSTGA